MSAASLAVAPPTSVNGPQGSHGALNAEAYSSTMVHSPGPLEPISEAFAQAFDFSDSASSDATTALMASVSRRLQFRSLVDFDFEARILERAGISSKRWCVQKLRSWR